MTSPYIYYISLLTIFVGGVVECYVFFTIHRLKKANADKYINRLLSVSHLLPYQSELHLKLDPKKGWFFHVSYVRSFIRTVLRFKNEPEVKKLYTETEMVTFKKIEKLSSISGNIGISGFLLLVIFCFYLQDKPLASLIKLHLLSIQPNPLYWSGLFISIIGIIVFMKKIFSSLANTSLYNSERYYSVVNSISAYTNDFEKDKLTPRKFEKKISLGNVQFLVNILYDKKKTLLADKIITSSEFRSVKNIYLLQNILTIFLASAILSGILIYFF